MFTKDELKHYGVLGMRWGVRNDKGGSGGARGRISRAGSSAKSISKSAGSFIKGALGKTYSSMMTAKPMEFNNKSEAVAVVGLTLAASVVVGSVMYNVLSTLDSL
jgi:hypothetical protein